MRVIVVPWGPSTDDPRGPSALAEALSAAGVRVDPPIAGLRARLGRAVSLVRGTMARPRPDAALVFPGPATFPLALLLTTLRIPIVGVLADVPKGGFGPLHLAFARVARALVTLDPEVARRLQLDLGVRGVEVLGGGDLDLQAVPTGPAEAARSMLGLEPTQRFLALTGPLDSASTLEPVAFAHRRMAGLGLLIIGTGPADPWVAAMTAATRPSSPILHIPTLDREARRVAVQAADAVLTLHPSAVTEDALLAAAVGRVLVSPAHPELDRIEALYPGRGAVIRVANPPSPDDLRAGIEDAIERGPLPDDAVATARRRLQRGRPVDHLLEVLASCGSSS